MRPAFHLTAHAVERYIHRVAPCTGLRDALLELTDAAKEATLAQRRTRSGAAIWIVQRPAMRLITKPADNGVVVITVLDGHTGGEEEALEEVLAAYHRLQAHPEVGTPEHVRPCNSDGRKEVGQWLHVETQRLLTERRRLEALAALEAGAVETAGRRSNLRDLLREASSMLAEIDARKAAGLLSRIDVELRRDVR